jgi:hypothetical protein|tara:strand:- start:158 stop:580 length:423 start_codon:yes stop_codon:yes gene_type:complete
MIPDTDKAYIAGLFDGEGSIYYKRLKQTRHNRPGKPVHNVWSIRMEIAMTDYSVLVWLYEVLGVGKLNPRKVKPGRKKQWRWRCTHRDAYYVCCLIWPWSHTKLDKVQQIIAHYTSRKLKENNVIDLALERDIRKLQDGR